MTSLRFPVHSGLCDVELTTDVSTGPRGCDSSPGVRFAVHLHENHPTNVGHGVIGRSDALRLHNLLREFLSRVPADASSRRIVEGEDWYGSVAPHHPPLAEPLAEPRICDGKPTKKRRRAKP